MKHVLEASAEEDSGGTLWTASGGEFADIHVRLANWVRYELNTRAFLLLCEQTAAGLQTLADQKLPAQTFLTFSVSRRHTLSTASASKQKHWVWRRTMKQTSWTSDPETMATVFPVPPNPNPSLSIHSGPYASKCSVRGFVLTWLHYKNVIRFGPFTEDLRHTHAKLYEHTEEEY